MDPRQFHNQKTKLYFSQFSHQQMVQNPSIDYVRFLILLLISILILMNTDDPILRDLFTITGAGAALIIVLILIFAKKRIS